MKSRNLFILLLLCLILSATAVGSVNAASYYIDGTTPEAYPTIGDLNYINTRDSWGGATTAFTYSGGGLSYTVDWTIYVPGNWDNSTTGGSNPAYDYADNNYRPGDGKHGLPSYEYGTNLTSEMSGGQSNFNNVYSYFYTVSVDPGSNPLSQMFIDFSNAELNDYGYLDSDLNGTADGSNDNIAMSDGSNTLQINFGGIGTGFLQDGETATFYMTSHSWYGLNSTSGSGFGGGSTAGTIPAPNPEAPVVALYIIGLMGMVGFTYMKKRQGEAF